MQDKNRFDFERFTADVKKLGCHEGVRCDPSAHSILGREIPIFTLGSGKRAVVYVGGICGTESLISSVLLDFVGDYCLKQERGGKVFDVSIPYLVGERRLIVVPMLNPDGIGYSTDGIDGNNPIRERVIRMNQGEDLSFWQANARGTDLSYNFDAGFGEHKKKAGIINGAPKGYGGEYPESEPESAALGRLLRFLGEDLLGLIEFRLGTGEIRCSCRDKLSAKTMAGGRILARATGYRLMDVDRTLPQGSVSDWCIEKLSRPAYRVDCNVKKFRSDRARECLFEALRRTFYTFPFML